MKEWLGGLWQPAKVNPSQKHIKMRELVNIVLRSASINFDMVIIVIRGDF